MATTKKTNKTSHVMNLLTNGTSPEAGGASDAAAPVDGSPAASQEKKGDVQSHTVTPSKVTVVDEGSRNDRLSQEIFNKLSEELEEETKETNKEDTLNAPEPEPEGIKMDSGSASLDESIEAQTPSDAQLPESEPEDTISSEPAEEEQETSLEPAEETAAEPQIPSREESSVSAAETDAAPKKATPRSIIPPSQIDQNLNNDQYRFVNVMEQLILRQDINDYLEQYNVCKCTRCMADVCALALSGLPAKYVVTSKDSISPLLSYYESRNKIPVLTALIKACNMVRENPRH
ncbi:MAG: hypothetical protein HFG49_09115 [Lachnospiraceae bacterium]|jgi:competence protein ComFB|nr:hypothetical protein [Lachnospiraceae bacterium]